MEKIEPRKIDKSKWGDGPWQSEPDRMEWEYKGFPCLMRRNLEVTGSWCGYVAVPQGHPAWEKDYDSVDISVHGGLTYSHHCHGDICHVPKPGEPDNVWWLGFDCAHAFDRSPLLEFKTNKVLGPTAFILGVPMHYWTAEEVKKEVESLADQLADLKMKKQTIICIALGFLAPLAFIAWITWMAYKQGFPVFQ